MTPPGSAGTAGRNYKIEPPTGRHRAPPLPPTPPKFARLLTPLAVLAAVGIFLPPVLLAATTVAPDARAAGVRGVTASTAERTARTVHVPLTILPAPVPVIGGPGIWDPDAPTGLFAGATTTASAAPGRPVATSGVTRTPADTPQAPQQALTAIPAPTVTTTPAQTASGTTTTRTTTTTTAAVTTTAAPPASTTATSSAPTSTEETPVIEPTQTAAPTDVIGDALDALDEVVGETP